jgi:hypothetical protein
MAKEKARALHTAQSIWGLYQIFVTKQDHNLLRVLRHRDTLPAQIIGLVGSVLDDGEVYVKSLLAQIAEPEVWDEVVKASGQEEGKVGCPLKYSEDEI